LTFENDIPYAEFVPRGHGQPFPPLTMVRPSVEIPTQNFGIGQGMRERDDTQPSPLCSGVEYDQEKGRGNDAAALNTLYPPTPLEQVVEAGVVELTRPPLNGTSYVCDERGCRGKSFRRKTEWT
jgi:hypothetical protein